MRRSRIWTTGAAIATLALMAGLLVASPALAKAVKLEEVWVRIEINDTDGDAGLHIFWDGEPWAKMKVFDPTGKVILNVIARGALGKNQGVTEGFFESSEPGFDEQPLSEFLALFPEGVYKFRGKTIEGDQLVGSALLTHALPLAPIVLPPIDDGAVVIEWMRVPNPPGSRIVGYQVVVETDNDEGAVRVFSADLPRSIREIRVPGEFLRPGGDYKYEVIARERSGNQTISEGEL
jgi:hypothetical protein